MAAYAILEVFDILSLWKLCEHHGMRGDREHKSQHVSISDQRAHSNRKVRFHSA
jgi:hypothetical protein